ncbi:MAG TPA: membrane dipeptidase [Rhodanobacteraceae bacterium]|nr:membrane dipeptidase [Rhodanobacteraceae bacterium]
MLMDRADLYRNAFVLDCNALESIGSRFEDAGRFDALAASGVTAVKTTLGGASGTFEETVADIAAAQALIEDHPECFIKVRRHADLERAKSEDKLAVIFSFEAASMLEDKPARIDLFRKLDVLVMQLSYNHATPFAAGCLDGETGGVTELGRKAIARMNELGVALDLSHANTRSTAEGIALSAKPPMITHAGCRAVFHHPRNKRDEEMKALADKGGVMGIYMLPLLTSEDRQPMLADYMQHLMHALKVCGEDHVGIGTDTAFFIVDDAELQALAEEAETRRKQGVGSPGENRPPYIPDINTPRKLERVADALLKHGYPARVAEKVLGLNFSRVFKEIWTA